MRLPWKAPDGKPVTTWLVFTSREHAALNRNYVNSYIWKPALERAGVPATREKRVPRAAALLRQRPAAQRVDVRALAEYPGHSDPGFTLRVYAHLMPTASDRMRAAVDYVLSGEADGRPRPRVVPDEPLARSEAVSDQQSK